MQDGPLQRYRQTVLSRELAPETAQELVAEKLQLLANRVAQYSEARPIWPSGISGAVTPASLPKWRARELAR